jgi:electron transfer flavoprotein alpha subunit
MIIGVAEHEHGVLTPSTLEVLTLARGLADQLGLRLGAVAFGPGSGGLAGDLARYGVSTLYVGYADEDVYAPRAWAHAVADVARTGGLTVAVVAPASERGNEAAAYIAAMTDAPMAANTTSVRPGADGTLELTRLRWAGSLIEDAVIAGVSAPAPVAGAVSSPGSDVSAPASAASGERGLVVLTVPAGAVVAEPRAGEAAIGSDAIEVIELDASPDERDRKVRVVERLEAVPDGVSLADARVVVGGGRGVGGEAGFGILEELAGLLGGTVGVSRVVTSEGWRPHRDQVGQTGTRIFPELYIACGISGAIQHMVGCKGARHILAINRDPDAPIMSKADYTVVGDLHVVLPAVVAAVRKVQAESAQRHGTAPA